MPSSKSKQGSKGALARNRREDDPPSRSGREEEEESESDKMARLRIGGFGVAEWVLSMCFAELWPSCIYLLCADAFTRNTDTQTKVEEFIAPLDNIALWSSLYHGQSAPFIGDELEAFGYNQPAVRRAGWVFLQGLLRSCRGKWMHISRNLF